MSHEPAVSLLLLLRLKAFAPTEQVAAALGWSTGSAHGVLAELEQQGWVVHRSGMAAGWSLTAEGRRHGERLLREELHASGSAAVVERCYRDFLPLNADLLSICTDWQTVVVDGEHVPNPHTDADHDAAVLCRLERLHRATLPLLGTLAGASHRFDPYPERLTRAHDRVRAGATEWIAKPTVDSYHGVWFELHEHLLVTLGRDRVSEPVPRSEPTPYVPTQAGESR